MCEQLVSSVVYEFELSRLYISEPANLFELSRPLISGSGALIEIVEITFFWCY